MPNTDDVTIDGERYEATVPDTLDLVERAELALNGLGGTLDPEMDYEMYFWIMYRARPAFMLHWGFDPDNEPKFAESFPFMRTMTGTDTYREAEQGLMKTLVGRLSRDDGLYYSQARPDRPWHSIGHPGYENVSEDFAVVAGNGRMLRAMTNWYERSGDSGWEERIRSLVKGLDRIAVRHDDYAYYPDGGFGEAFAYPRSGWRSTREPQDEHESGEATVVAYQGHQIQGLARWAAISGDEEALDLAGRLTRFVMLPRFWGAEPEVPGVAGREQGHFDSKFHARAIALRGILEYAMVADDPRVKEFVRASYEFGRSLGIARIGWYPSPNRLTCEGCTLGDMVALGVRLTDAGVADYWDDVDQLARNQLIEGQLADKGLLEEVSEAGPERPAGSQWWWNYGKGPYRRLKIHPKQEANENVIERSLGVYTGYSTPTVLPETWVMQCCTGNGTQGLYYAWEGAVRCQDGRAQVNLLLNRASRWLDVDSYLPYEGKVIIRNKTASSIAVRIPGWVPRRDLRTRVNNVDRQTAWVGNHTLFNDLKPEDSLLLEFPVIQRSAEYTAWSRIFPKQQTYHCDFRGNTLVDISPREDSPGCYPLYRRDELRNGGPAPMKKITRFAAGKELHRW